jgi:hypothetical protein
LAADPSGFAERADDTEPPGVGLLAVKIFWAPGTG